MQWDVVGLALVRALYLFRGGMDDIRQESGKPQLRAASYARLSETYDEAESVPIQFASAGAHAQRRGWWRSATTTAIRQEIRRGCHGARPSRPSVPPSVYACYVQTRARLGDGTG